MANHCGNYFFAFGLVNSVMRKYSSSWLSFNPSGDKETLYTPQMEEAVIKILDRRDIELFFLFSNEFASKGITLDSFIEISQAIQVDFTSDPFDAKEFIWFCIIMAYYSFVANRRGVAQAPFQATNAIMNFLDHYRITGEFTDDKWPDLEQAAIKIAQDP